MRLAFPSQVIRTLSDLEASVADIDGADLRSVEGALLRVDYALWTLLISNDELASKELDERAKAVSQRIPGFVLYLAPNPSDFCRRTTSFKSLEQASPRKLVPSELGPHRLAQIASELPDLAQADLQNFFDSVSHRCVIRGSETIHFELPSGAHTSQFIRLADAFRTVEALDRVSYWVALRILQAVVDRKAVGVLLVDNPSMLALAVRVIAMTGIDAVVECLQAYPKASREAADAETFIKRLAEKYKSVFCVISVASTGGILRIAKQALEGGIAEETLDVVTLFSTRDIADANELCKVTGLEGYKHFISAHACELCSENNKTVAIDSSTYFFSYGNPEEIVLPPKAFDQQKEFIDRYGAVDGVLRVHYNDPNDDPPRHHAFYADVGTLMLQPAFIDEFKSRLNSINPKPEVIFSPKHSVASTICAVASEHLGIPHFPHESYRLSADDPQRQRIQAYLATAKNVLVIDDVVITGSRLRRFNEAFREDVDLFGGVKNLTFFPLIALPSSVDEFEKCKRGLVTNHNQGSWKPAFETLYVIPLPNWHKNEQCPWCEEKKILMSLLQRVDDLDPPFEARLQQLNRSETGLTAEWAHVAPGCDVPLMGGGSNICGSGWNGTQVLFACASAVQQLRKSSSKPLDASGFPIPRLLAGRVFVQNYSEMLLWVALLRGLSPVELHSAAVRGVTARILGIQYVDDDKYAMAEMAVAGLRGHLGGLMKNPEAVQIFNAAGINQQFL